MNQFLVVASLLIGGFVTAACEPASSPTAASAVTVSAPVTPAPTPVPPSRSQFVLKPDSLSGVVSEMTSDGLVPLGGVQIYCDACGEFGHTYVTTDENGAYDFGRDGIWSDDRRITAILVFKEGYFIPGGSLGPSTWTSQHVRTEGETRFDFQMVRRE